jgi:hypothetical protein
MPQTGMNNLNLKNGKLESKDKLVRWVKDHGILQLIQLEIFSGTSIYE